MDRRVEEAWANCCKPVQELGLVKLRLATTLPVVGEMVMDALRTLDHVAYIRFASVYKNFREAKDFEDFVGKLGGDDGKDI